MLDTLDEGQMTKEFLTAKTKKLNGELAADFETLSKAAEVMAQQKMDRESGVQDRIRFT